jgi:hypothetical protein
LIGISASPNNGRRTGEPPYKPVAATGFSKRRQDSQRGFYQKLSRKLPRRRYRPANRDFRRIWTTNSAAGSREKALFRLRLFGRRHDNGAIAR